MTKFVKEQFDFHGGYLYYHLDAGLCAWERRKFIARFKYHGGGKGSWITFLINNFTVEEYLGRLDAGESPLDVMRSKGFILPHVRKWLKEGGYPVTPTGYEAFLQDRITKVYKNAA